MEMEHKKYMFVKVLNLQNVKHFVKMSSALQLESKTNEPDM